MREDGLLQAVDLGCGTGEQTRMLSERFPASHFLGVDASAQMLQGSDESQSSRLAFQQATIESFLDRQPPQSMDLVFSNAALQWCDDHEVLFPKVLDLLRKGGQLAVQMPVKPENVIFQLLLQLVQESPFKEALDGWKRASPVLNIDRYTTLMFEAGLVDLQIIQKVYPVIADTVEVLYDYTAATTLVPYVDRLQPDLQSKLEEAFKERIANHFEKFPAIYAFKRMLLYGRMPNA
jgi:trans-aconitate 2-methyltransferase